MCHRAAGLKQLRNALGFIPLLRPLPVLFEQARELVVGGVKLGTLQRRKVEEGNGGGVRHEARRIKHS